MSRKNEIKAEFSIAEARQLVRDLFQPKPWIYWTDFLTSLAFGMGAFLALRRFPWTELAIPARLPLLLGTYLAAVIAFYRASLFTHELTHLRHDSFRTFRVVWNLLYGIPFLVPSFLYHTHVDHHARRQYGTAGDGEYLPLASGPRWKIFWYLAESFVVQLIAVVRFAVAPAGWILPSVRRWLARHASSMVIDPTYVRPIPTAQELKLWRLQEALCFLWIVGVAAVIVAGWVPFGFLLTAYAVSVGAMLLNSVRTLGAHRYRSSGEPMTFVEQLLDSVNYPRHPILSAVWAPVGLRFHALHHLFPSMPYHNLALAHQRLMEGLPTDSLYRQTVSDGLRQTIGQLWSEAGKKPSTSIAASRIRAGRADRQFADNWELTGIMNEQRNKGEQQPGNSAADRRSQPFNSPTA